MDSFVSIIKTEDGSHTLINKELNVTYHSVFGAVQESNYVFIQEGIHAYHIANPSQNKIKVFELGFGTGLNCALTHQYANRKSIQIEYHSIEKYPVPFIISDELNYNGFADSILTDIHVYHHCNWNHIQTISPQFDLLKIEGDFITYQSAQQYDLFYLDAFDPKIQPLLWNLDAMNKAYAMLRDKGLLVTYCAQGQLKRDLKSIGFEVETLKGPPGKREMIRAWKEK